MFLFRTSRFTTFPEYMVVQLKKFTFGVDWVPKKLGAYYGVLHFLFYFMYVNIQFNKILFV